MHLFKTTPKKDIERSQPYIDWLKKNISELIQGYKNELKSKFNNYPSDEVDPDDKTLRKHPIGSIFFELQDTVINGLTVNSDVPFNFKPALKLIQICNSGENHFLRPIEPKLTMVCRKQFFVVLIRKIDFVLEALRTDTTLNITTDSQGHETDPLNSHVLGQHLLPIRTVCESGYRYSAVSVFNIETLSALHAISQQSRFSDKIKASVSQIYQMIIDDIKTPSSLLGGHFTYTNLNTDLAIELITDFLKQEKEFEELQKKQKSENKEPEKHKHPIYALIAQSPKINFGELLWRIVLLLKPENLKIITDAHASLISQMRQSASFQAYELLSDSNQSLFKDILQSPWSLQFFTIRQIIGLINSKLSDANREILLQQSFQLRSNVSANQVNCSEPSLFATNKPFQNGKSLKSAEEIRQENTKNMLLTFLTLHAKYTKNIINDAANLKELFLTVGIKSELMPLLEPTTIINLFLEADRYLPLALEDLKSYLIQKQNGSEVKITGNIIRNFTEYNLLLARIVEDIKHGDKAYFESLLKIPYLLFELIKRETLDGKNGFLQLPAQTVLPFFAVFNVKIIFDTLRLLDTQDPIHNTMVVNTIEYKIDKNDTQSAFQRFAQFLMSIGFLEFRKSWLQSEEASSTLREYPFLLKDFSSNEIDNLVTKDQEQDTFVEYAELALKNGVNSFLCCPQLLIYLTPEKIIEVHQKSSLAELLSLKEMPEKVVTYLFNKMSQLKGAIPGLEQYIKQQKENAELASLLTPLPASKSQTQSNKTGAVQQKQVSLSLEAAIALIDDDVKIQTERRERADEQKRRELERKKEQDEYELKLKQEEEAHRINLAEYESKLEQLRKSKQEELTKLQLAHAEQKEKLEEEIARERKQWELELARMNKEKEILQKEIEEETARRIAEKEENDKNTADLARMLLEEQERLLKENEQRAKELEEILKRQEAERATNEQQIKKLEENHRLRMEQYEREQKQLIDRDFADKQEKLEHLRRQKDAELKRREEELERVRLAQDAQKENIASELRKREQEEKTRQEKAQQEERRRKEKLAELERKELAEEQLFQQEEEKRRRQLKTLEEKKQQAIDTHIINQNKNQKAIDDIYEKNKKQEEERAAIEQQAAELARAKKEMEEFRKRLKEEEDKINREKEELKKRAQKNEQTRRELDDAYRAQDKESSELDRLDEELRAHKKAQQELRQQLDQYLEQNKRQEAEYKKHLAESDRIIRQQEEEFQRKVADNQRRQQELEAALKDNESEQQQLEAARLHQEKAYQATLEENERIRKAKAEQYTKLMEQLEAESRQQEGSTHDQLEAKRREIERVKKDRASELARQQFELEELEREETTRKKQLEEEKQRRLQEQANQRKSVDAFSREARELEEAHIRALHEAQRKRQEAEKELKSQNDKLKTEELRFKQEAEELKLKQDALSSGQQRQAAERAALKQKAEALALEIQKDKEIREKLAEHENKLLKEREQRAAEQETKRKEQEARKKEEEQKCQQDELRHKKAEQEKQRKAQEESRKKEEERKRQEEERSTLSSVEQAERQRKIEEERARQAKIETNYKRRQLELAAQPVSPAGNSSPIRTATPSLPLAAIGLNSSTSVAASPITPPSAARNIAAVGLLQHPARLGSPRNGINVAHEGSGPLSLSVPKRRDDDDRSRSAKVFDPTTVNGALSSFTRDELAAQEAEAKAAALTKTPPLSPKGKGL